MSAIFSFRIQKSKWWVLLFFTICLFRTVISEAQQSINTLGANIQTHSGTISYTLGQIDFISIEDGDEWMNLGVQQPYIPMIEKEVDRSGCVVFPNPTSSFLFLRPVDPEIISIRYTIYNVNGLLADFGENIMVDEYIDISRILPGVYFIKIISNNDKIWECKIVKI